MDLQLKLKGKTRNQTKSVEKNYTFESLLGDISTKLVNLPIESIDSAIESSMKMLVDFFDVDRCHLGEFSDDNSKITISYFYTKSGYKIPQSSDIGEDYLSFVFNSIKQDKSIVFSKSSELPATAKKDRTTIDKIGIKSLLVLPIKIGDAIQFGISLATVANHINWTKQDITRIKIMANILGNVLHRKIVLEKLYEEKEWAEAVIQGMPQVVYVLDLEGKLKRWNKNLEDVFGYPAEELSEITPGDLLNEKDYARVMAAIQKAIEDGKEHSVEYDLVTKSGKILPYYYGTGKLINIGSKSYVIGQAVDVSEMKHAQEKVSQQLEEIKLLKDQLKAENLYLKQELSNTKSIGEIIGESDVIKHILYRIEQVAPLDTTVLLEGETGTGKELFAREIHQRSARRGKPMIVVNCASLPAELIESELFGHEKGSFTGATEKQIGRFELADGGTVFLDEVSEIPIKLQVKLLRVLQEGEFERIGNPRTIRVDVRVIAATNRSLENEIRKGSFRDDLYYRLNVYPITIAPLRERTEDIPLLVTHFVNRFNAKMGKRISRISKKVISSLKSYDWPGNIRELENIVERSMILSKGSILSVEKLQAVKNKAKESLLPLAELERNHIIKVLDRTLWRISGPDGAARILEMHPETLRSRMHKLGIKRPNSKPTIS